MDAVVETKALICSPNLGTTLIPIKCLIWPMGGLILGMFSSIFTMFRDLLLPACLIRLHAFRDFSRFRILIGGGDGTFGWVLSVLEEAQDALQFKNPPCALLPLGTGNDLARVLSWGPGYSGEKVLSILRSVENADLVYLDR